MTALLGGALSADLLAEVAGRPLRAPLALVHAGHPGGRADKHLLFLAESGAAAPFAVVKWARGAAAAGLRREQAALAALRALPDARLRASCPPGWGPFPVDGGALVAVERYLPGESAHAQLRTSLWPRRPAARHFRLCSAWYARFAAATRGAVQVFDDALLDEYIAAPLRTLAARFGPLAVPAAALETTLAAARRLRGRPVALTAEHGDLWPANLLLPPDGGGLYVVDWEHFRPAALPGFDLLCFCTTYALELPWRPFGWTAPASALDRAYFRPTWLGGRIARLLARGCAAVGLPRAFLPVLLPVMLARMALRRQVSVPTVGTYAAESGWLAAVQCWWRRPADNWLESWAHADTFDH